MGILDYSYRLKAHAGAVAPVDETGYGGTLSGGTITLTDRGGGDYVWRFSGSQSIAEVDSVFFDKVTAGGGFTFAVTVDIQTLPSSGNYQPLLGFLYNDADSTHGLHFDRTAGASGRFRFRDQALAGPLSSINTERTYVCRVTTSILGGSGEGLPLWIDTNNRQSNDPDIEGERWAEPSDRTMKYVFVDPVSGAVIDVKDIVIWPEELTDAQCAALADDLRGELDGGSPPAEVKGVRLTLGDGTTPAASLSGLSVRWWDGAPTGAPDFEANSLTTDAQGLLEIDIDSATQADIDDLGYILVYKTGAAPEDDLIAAGRAKVVDIS